MGQSYIRRDPHFMLDLLQGGCIYSLHIIRMVYIMLPRRMLHGLYYTYATLRIITIGTRS